VATPIPFFTDKRQEFIASLYFPDKDRYILDEVEYSPRRRTRATEWRLRWGPCGLSFVFV